MNYAHIYLGKLGENVEQWEGYCGELASNVAGEKGSILHVEGEIWDRWRYHQVPVLDGLVHDAWCPGPARPIADWLRFMFGSGWVEVAIDAIDCYEGPADRFALLALPERGVLRRPAWLTGTADCDWDEDADHDKRNDRWSAWEEPSQAELYANYGTTPEQWRDACRRWIEIGGTYEFKIVRRTDTVEWSIHYENAKRMCADKNQQHQIMKTNQTPSEGTSSENPRDESALHGAACSLSEFSGSASNESLHRGPSLEISINKSGGSVSASRATIASSRVIGVLDGPCGGVTGSRTVNPRSFCAVNLVVGEQSGLGVGGNPDIPVGVGVSGNSLHVRINLGDDFGVGHGLDLLLEFSQANETNPASGSK